MGPTLTPSALLEKLVASTNAHDLDGLVDCFAVDYELTDPAHPVRSFTGVAQVRKNWAALFAAVPDIRLDVQQRVCPATASGWRAGRSAPVGTGSRWTTRWSSSPASRVAASPAPTSTSPRSSWRARTSTRSSEAAPEPGRPAGVRRDHHRRRHRATRAPRRRAARLARPQVRVVAQVQAGGPGTRGGVRGRGRTPARDAACGARARDRGRARRCTASTLAPGSLPQQVDRDGNTNLFVAGRRAGAHIVLMSVVGAAPGHPMELHRMKAAAEQALRRENWTRPARLDDRASVGVRGAVARILMRLAGRNGVPKVFGRGRTGSTSSPSRTSPLRLPARPWIRRCAARPSTSGGDDLTLTELAARRPRAEQTGTSPGCAGPWHPPATDGRPGQARADARHGPGRPVVRPRPGPTAQPWLPDAGHRCPRRPRCAELR